MGAAGLLRGGAFIALQIVAASEVPKGAEVHNTYGELGNVDLVSKYGFALSDNPFSVVVLDKASVLQAAERTMGVREMRLRSRFLRKERYEPVFADDLAALSLYARSGYCSCLSCIPCKPPWLHRHCTAAFGH